MILHTQFLLHFYLISFFFGITYPSSLQNPDSKETKFAKSEKKIDEDTVWRMLIRKLKRPCVDSQDRKLLWLGYTTQSINLVRDFHSVL